MDIQFNLRERTTIISGTFSSTIQNLIIGLTQMGSDVAFVDKDAQQATKFCQNVTDQREVNEKQGRAMAVPADLQSLTSIKDSVSKVAQTFGSIDIFIDANYENKKTPMLLESDQTDLDPIIHRNLKTSLMLTQCIVGYLKNRKRGRLLYLVNDSVNKGTPEDLFATAARGGLIPFAKTLSKQLREFNVTANVLSLGLTEEYVLGHFPECTSIKEAIEKMKAAGEPGLRISEPDKITHAILFLTSQFGSGITGQVLTL